MKDASQHIIEKAKLIEAGIKLLVIADKDLQSYGFGGWYQKVGTAASEMYMAIWAIEPNKLPALPFVEKFMKGNK